MGGALFGQGLNFLAMLLPIVGGETGQLAYLMVPLALGTILSRSSILAFHARYLTLPESKISTATTASVAGLLATTAVTLATAVLIHFVTSNSSAAEATAWAAYITLTNGVYFMAVAIVTREQKIGIYSTARMWYGVINITLTTIAVFIYPADPGLVIIAGMTTTFGAIYILIHTENNIASKAWRNKARILNSDHRSYIYNSRGATFGTLLGELGFQFQGLLTPLFGAYQEIWAAVVRMTGGFGSLAQQVIAPSYESRIASAIRDRDPAATRKMCRNALLSGIAISMASALALTVALAFSLRGNDSLTATSLSLSTIYCVAVLSVSLCLKIPLMKKRERLYMSLSALHLIALTTLLLTSGLELFIAVTVVQVALSIMSASISLGRSKV